MLQNMPFGEYLTNNHNQGKEIMKSEYELHSIKTEELKEMALTTDNKIDVLEDHVADIKRVLMAREKSNKIHIVKAAIAELIIVARDLESIGLNPIALDDKTQYLNGYLETLQETE